MCTIIISISSSSIVVVVVVVVVSVILLLIIDTDLQNNEKKDRIDRSTVTSCQWMPLAYPLPWGAKGLSPNFKYIFFNFAPRLHDNLIIPSTNLGSIPLCLP